MSRRWLAVLLLLLVPLQVSYAALHEYVEHQLISDGSEVPVLHAHGHESTVPMTGDLPDGDHHGNSSVPADLPDGGFAHIHLGYAALILVPQVVAAGAASIIAMSEPDPYPSATPQRLDRPPLRARG